MTHVEKRGKRGQNTKYRRRLHALVYIEADKTDSNVCLALDIRAEKSQFPNYVLPKCDRMTPKSPDTCRCASQLNSYSASNIWAGTELFWII
jgi:hypothetical protein